MLTRIALSTALVVGTAAAAFAAVEENKIGDIYPVPAYVTQHRASGMDAFAMRPPVVQQRTLQQRTVQRQAAQPRNAQRRAARAVGGFSTTEKMAFARIDAFRW